MSCWCKLLELDTCYHLGNMRALLYLILLWKNINLFHRTSCFTIYNEVVLLNNNIKRVSQFLLATPSACATHPPSCTWICVDSKKSKKWIAFPFTTIIIYHILYCISNFFSNIPELLSQLSHLVFSLRPSAFSLKISTFRFHFRPSAKSRSKRSNSSNTQKQNADLLCKSKHEQ